jgi:ATP-dependent Clp protease adapter protein ClpS
VFVKEVLRRIFAPKMDEDLEEWRKLHNKGFTVCSVYLILSW